MQQAKTTRAEAIVLRTMEYAEADKILTLYTPTLGKVHAIAKGVRRPTSRMGGHLDLFAHATILLVHGRTLDIVTQGQGLHAFTQLRHDLDRLAKACYAVELVDRFTEDHNPAPDLFRLLLRALERIDSGTRPAATLLLFTLHLLSLSGYRPQLHRCVTCEHTIEPGSNAFDSELGGVLCPQCAPAHATARPISDTALKLLRNLQTRGEALLQLTAIPAAAQSEAEEVIGRYVQYLLDRRPKSAAFLETIRQINQSNEQPLSNSVQK